VAVSALAAICWMITHKDYKGIFFPEDIMDYKYILKLAEKYISKTIYKTFDKETLGEALKADLSKAQAKDFFIS
jgi:homospermidine synthase